MSLCKADVDYFIVDKVSRLDGMNNGTAITSHYGRESLLHKQLVAYQVITGWHLYKSSEWGNLPSVAPAIRSIGLM